MKTTDLISLILYELGEGDKYGFELTKSIENLSNGKIVIKQATLYTILKKLEKSKFISSYWQDSEIGGKRHYYKLTENGNMQLATMPNISTIINNLIENDQNFNDAGESTVIDSHASNPNLTPIQPSSKTEDAEIVNDISDTSSINVKEPIVPSDEVFKENSLDSKTEIEINSENANLLHTKNETKGEEFANNKDVLTFVGNQQSPVTPPNDNFLDSFKPIETPQLIQPQKINKDEIKYVEYVDYNQNANYLRAKAMIKNMKLRIISSTVYMLAMLAICSILINVFSSTIISNIFISLGILVLLFFPTIFAYKFDSIKIKCQDNKLQFNAKKHIIIASCASLALLLLIFILNITLTHYSFINLFKFSNFANLYAPIIISSFILADLLFSYIFIYRQSKR